MAHICMAHFCVIQGAMKNRFEFGRKLGIEEGLIAGPMNLEQMSRSLRSFLFTPPISPSLKVLVVSWRRDES